MRPAQRDIRHPDGGRHSPGGGRYRWGAVLYTGTEDCDYEALVNRRDWPIPNEKHPARLSRVFESLVAVETVS